MVHYFLDLGLDLLRRVWVPYMFTLRTQGHQEISKLICRWVATPDLVMSCLKRRAQGATRYPRSCARLPGLGSGVVSVIYLGEGFWRVEPRD